MEIKYVGSKSKDNESALGCGVFLVVALILGVATQCGGQDSGSDTASTAAKPSATASIKTGSPTHAVAGRKKVTMRLAEIVETPGTLGQFKKFVAEHGTVEQKQAVKHLTKWRGYSRKVYPAIEVASDYPTVDYEAVGASDAVIALEKQSQYIAEAFAAWWQTDELSVIQVFDRGGKYTAGTSCIRTDSAKADGSCLNL
jgi:formylglycine-generating enzyme required for sulfatase activity